MSQAPFVCRNCLSRIRQARSHPVLARAVRNVAQIANEEPGGRPNATKGPPNAQSKLQTDSPPSLIRKYDPFPVFRKYVPSSEDKAYRRAVRSQEVQGNENPASMDRQFDASNYSPDDQVFWDKFEDFWGTAEGRRQQMIQSDPARVARPTYSTTKHKERAKSLPEEFRIQRQPKWYFSKKTIADKQLGYLLHKNDPSNSDLAGTRFWAWKKFLTYTWKMLEKGMLPRKKAEISRLRWLLRQGELDAMKEAWKLLPPDKRQSIWPQIMISALRSQPEKARLVLESTFDATLVPSYTVQDTIHYFARQRAATLPADTHVMPLGDLYSMVRTVLSSSAKGYLQLRQRTVYLLASELESQELAEFYHLLVEYGHPLHEFTLLQIGSRLAKAAAHKDLSLSILDSMLRTTKMDLNAPRGASLCTSLLTMTEGDFADTTTAKPAELFEDLLQRGLRPNLITYTTIIRSLSLTGDLDAAWSVFSLMIRLNTEPDAYLDSTLLNGAKLGQSLGRIRDVVRMAARKGIRDPVVWNDFLHSIFLSAAIEARRKKLKPPRVIPALRLMLQAYAKLFAMAPLKTLLLIDVDQFVTPESGQTAALAGWSFFHHLAPSVRDLPQLPAADMMEPTGSTLGIMLLGYVRAISKPYDIIAFYSHFRKLLKEGHPAAVRTVAEQGSLVHDMTIKAICEWPGMLRVALDVVSDMLKDATASRSPGASDTAPRHPAPSVYTWSILLNGFMFHRQKKQAEKILHMMREHGVEPTVVTWNTLAAGYARTQDVGKTVKTLQRLEGAGHTADDFTFKAFGYLRNKTDAIIKMEALIERRKKREEEQARQRAAGGDVAELQALENEVEGIARMMDEDADGLGYEAGDGVL